MASSVNRVLALLLVADLLGSVECRRRCGHRRDRIEGGTQVRVAPVFGIFEAGIPLLGHSLARPLGHAAHWIVRGAASGGGSRQKYSPAHIITCQPISPSRLLCHE